MANSMNKSLWQSRTNHDLLIEVWEKLDCESVGSDEIQQIQAAVRETLGAGAVQSPATIARTLADEGAVLRHPEVLNSDSQWREQRLSELIPPDDLNFRTLEQASASIKRLTTEHSKLRKATDHAASERLRELVVAHKIDTQQMARSKILPAETRARAKEVSLWLTIWLEQPEVFDEWLDLRQRSPEFIRKFGQ
jgi:hypothetical protein